MASSLRERVARHGHNRDVRIPADTDIPAEMGETRIASPRWSRSYRDDRARDSLHVAIPHEDADEWCVHLEHFNPEHHLLLHLLVDVPLWWLRSRIRPWYTSR